MPVPWSHRCDPHQTPLPAFTVHRAALGAHSAVPSGFKITIRLHTPKAAHTCTRQQIITDSQSHKDGRGGVRP